METALLELREVSEFFEGCPMQLLSHPELITSFHLPISTVEFDLQSMVICGKKNEKGEYEFLSPGHRDWNGLLLYNWKQKCKAAGLELSKMER